MIDIVDVARCAGRCPPVAMLRLVSLRRALLLLVAASCAALAAWLLLTRLLDAHTAGNISSLSRGGGAGAGPERSDEWSPWTWECNALRARCVRRVRRGADPRTPLISCQMACGEPPLWPRPTGNASVAKDSVVLHPDALVFHIEGADARVTRYLVRAAERARGRLAALRPVPAPNYAPDVDEVAVVLALLPPSHTPHPAPASAVAPNSASAGGGTGAGAGSGTGPACAVSDDPLRLALDVDERYALLSARDPLRPRRVRVRLSARSFFGLRHALETLVQLAWWDGSTLRLLHDAEILDGPEFPYRGLMVDTARNFYPISALRATIDAMAACKLNVFHWHMTDSHSFPFDSPSLPQMARYGAYSADATYSAADVEELTEYALERGVRVLPEIDTPAHSGNGWQWGMTAGMGQLAFCVNQGDWQEVCGQPPCGQLNPDNEHVYDMLGNLYKELILLTRTSDLFHLGGDEVNFECWRQNVPNMTSHDDYFSKWLYFEERARALMARAAGGQCVPMAIIWSSPLTRLLRLDPRLYAVQVWNPTGWGDAKLLLEANYKLILSHVDAWYLDCGLGDYRRAGENSCGPFRTWQHVYQHAPWRDEYVTGVGAGASAGAAVDQAGGTQRAQTQQTQQTQQAQQQTQRGPAAASALGGTILGGEACLWSERSDVQVLDARLWPRAAALAERLWSDPEPGLAPGEHSLPDGSNDETLLKAHARIAILRDRLVAWGVKADAVQPLWCQQNPEQCF